MNFLMKVDPSSKITAKFSFTLNQVQTLRFRSHICSIKWMATSTVIVRFVSDFSLGIFRGLMLQFNCGIKYSLSLRFEPFPIYTRQVPACSTRVELPVVI